MNSISNILFMGTKTLAMNTQNHEHIVSYKIKQTFDDTIKLINENKFAKVMIASGLFFCYFKLIATKVLQEGRHKLSLDEHKKLHQRIQNEFIEFINSYDFKDVITNKMGKLHICFIGPVSVGKSTLINQVFGTKQLTGLGQTTTKVEKVFEDDLGVVWDAPGINEIWQQYQEKDISFFKSLDKVYLLYSGSVREIRFIAKVLNKIGTKIVLVRTKCDEHKKEMLLTVDEQIKKDKLKFSSGKRNEWSNKAYDQTLSFLIVKILTEEIQQTKSYKGQSNTIINGGIYNKINSKIMHEYD